MIADNRETAFEVAVKMITAPVWVPIYLAYVGCRRVAEARADAPCRRLSRRTPWPLTAIVQLLALARRHRLDLCASW